jgi:putative transposase
MQRFGCSQRQALRIVRMSASSYLYVSQRRDESVLKAHIKEITDTRVHYGYRRVHVMLRREGHVDNVKRVYRLYREEGLSLRLKRPRRNKAAQRRQPKQLAHAINEIWSMDFVADALFDGRKLRMLTVVDLFTRESLAIDVGQSLKGEDVVRVLTAICHRRMNTPQFEA